LSEASSPRELDSLYVVRAFAISAVVANHSLTIPVAGGLNLLFLLSGVSFSQLCFGGHDRSGIFSIAIRFVRPLVIWSVIMCLLWFAAFRRVEWPEILMFSNWITENRVSKFPIWYTQVIIQMMIVIVGIFWAFRLSDGVRALPVGSTLIALALTVSLATVAQAMFNTDALKDKLPHLHAWNFILGWVFWAVLMNRKPTTWDRIAMTVLCVPLLTFMFLALDVPAAMSRVRLVILPVLLLIWVPTVRLPRAVAQPVLLISQATLFLFFLHYPFLLTVRNLFEGNVNDDFLGVMKFAVALLGPILIWAVLTAARRTLQEAKSRRSKAFRQSRTPLRSVAESR
jgi:hypothetical protein